jgi:hypothetical protein
MHDVNVKQLEKPSIGLRMTLGWSQKNSHLPAVASAHVTAHRQKYPERENDRPLDVSKHPSRLSAF